MKIPLSTITRRLGVVCATLWFGLLAPAVAGPAEGLSAHYEFSGPDKNPKHIVLDLTVSRVEGGKLAVEFSGAHADGSGAAPEGEGKARLDGEGLLRFDYEDSFSNKGTGTLRRQEGDKVKLTIDIKDVKDARCLEFYGAHVLQRTQSKDH